MRDVVQAILWFTGTWLLAFFFRLVVSPRVEVFEAAIFASVWPLLVFMLMGLFLIYAKLAALGEEKSKYYKQVEEAKATVHMGWLNPDVLLVGCEYCNVSGSYSDKIWDIHYFSVNNQRVEKSEIYAPQGEGWIQIRYLSDREGSSDLYYRKIKK